MATSDKKTLTTKYNTRAAVRKGASEPVVTKKKDNKTDKEICIFMRKTGKFPSHEKKKGLIYKIKRS